MSQLTEELKKKTKLIQSFLLREQHGRIKPPGKEQELHKKVNSIMDTIYAPNSAGKKSGFGGGTLTPREIFRANVRIYEITLARKSTISVE